MRRRGLPSSEKLPRVGRATLLHQHSSRKPTAQVSGLAPATSISRSRRLFSFIQGVGGGDPAFGPLPSHSEKTRQGGPDGLARDPPPCKPLLEARLCCHLQSPKARVVSELPRRAVEHLPQSLGTLLVEGVAGPSGARGSGNESIHAPLVEVMDGIAHRLLSAAEALGDSRSMLAPRARQKHLASAQGESVFRAQPGLEGFTLLFGERTYKDWSFHGPYCNSQHETYLEDAIGLSYPSPSPPTVRRSPCSSRPRSHLSLRSLGDLVQFNRLVTSASIEATVAARRKRGIGRSETDGPRRKAAKPQAPRSS